MMTNLSCMYLLLNTRYLLICVSLQNFTFLFGSIMNYFKVYDITYIVSNICILFIQIIYIYINYWKLVCLLEYTQHISCNILIENVFSTRERFKIRNRSFNIWSPYFEIFIEFLRNKQKVKREWFGQSRRVYSTNDWRNVSFNWNESVFRTCKWPKIGDQTNVVWTLKDSLLHRPVPSSRSRRP